MRALTKEYKNVKVYILNERGYVDGELTSESFSDAPVITKMAPRPITLSLEKRLPEGSYKAGDMKFYVDGNVEFKSGDIIEYKNVKYRIGDIAEREEGNYTMYMTARIYDQTRKN